MITLYSDEKYTVTNNFLRYGFCALFMIVAIFVIVARMGFLENFGIKFSFDNKALIFLILIVLFGLALIILFLKSKLSINAHEIKFSTFFSDVIKKKNIVKTEIREFSPDDVSGFFSKKVWGAKLYKFGDTNMGVLITMKDGNNLFITSSEPQRLMRALK